MRARDWPCPFLGRPADQLHHLTGRDADGRYFDPLLVVPVVGSQHVAEHVGWRAVGFGDGSTALPDVLRLRRVAHFLVRLGEHHGGGVVVLPAPSVRALGLVLHGVAESVERRQ